MLEAVWSRPAEGRDGTPLLIMLHGYGSDEATMADYFPAMPASFTCAAVRGCFEMDESYGWFLLNYFLGHDFAQVVESANKIFNWLDVVQRAHGFTSVSLLGHSQGMAMATTLLRLRPQTFRAVVGLSGFVLSVPLLAALDPPPVVTPFFWGRDEADLMINREAVNFSGRWLARNTRLQQELYPGMGHGIGQEELIDAASFLTVNVPFRPTA